MSEPSPCSYTSHSLRPESEGARGEGSGFARSSLPSSGSPASSQDTPTSQGGWGSTIHVGLRHSSRPNSSRVAGGPSVGREQIPWAGVSRSWGQTRTPHLKSPTGYQVEDQALDPGWRETLSPGSLSRAYRLQSMSSHEAGRVRLTVPMKGRGA